MWAGGQRRGKFSLGWEESRGCIGVMNWEPSPVGQERVQERPSAKHMDGSSHYHTPPAFQCPSPPHQQCWHPRNLPNCCLLLFPFYLYSRLLFQETCLKLGLLLSPEPSSGMRSKGGSLLSWPKFHGRAPIPASLWESAHSP